MLPRGKHHRPQSGDPPPFYALTDVVGRASHSKWPPADEVIGESISISHPLHSSNVRFRLGMGLEGFANSICRVALSAVVFLEASEIIQHDA